MLQHNPRQGRRTWDDPEKDGKNSIDAGRNSRLYLEDDSDDQSTWYIAKA